MENNKNQSLNVVIKKINKNSQKIEWTDTLEIPYEKKEDVISNEEKQIIEQQFSKKDKNNNSNFENDSFFNSRILSMEFNPFYQPSMNTIEFSGPNTIIIADIAKNNNEQIDFNEKMLVLERLLKDEIITKEEFNAKKELLSKINTKSE